MYVYREALKRSPDGLLSGGDNGKQLVSRVQLLSGVDGKYMIGSVQYSNNDHAKLRKKLAEGVTNITWGGDASAAASTSGTTAGVAIDRELTDRVTPSHSQPVLPFGMQEALVAATSRRMLLALQRVASLLRILQGWRNSHVASMT